MHNWFWQLSTAAVVVLFGHQGSETPVDAKADAEDELSTSPSHNDLWQQHNSSLPCECPSSAADSWSLVQSAIAAMPTNMAHCALPLLWNALSCLCLVVQIYNGHVRHKGTASKGSHKSVLNERLMRTVTCKETEIQTSSWAQDEILRIANRSFAKTKMEEVRLKKQLTQIVDERDTRKKEVHELMNSLQKAREKICELARASKKKSAQISTQADRLNRCLEENQKLALRHRKLEQELLALKAVNFERHDDGPDGHWARPSTQMPYTPPTAKVSQEQRSPSTTLDCAKAVECYDSKHKTDAELKSGEERQRTEEARTTTNNQNDQPMTRPENASLESGGATESKQKDNPTSVPETAQQARDIHIHSQRTLSAHRRTNAETTTSTTPVATDATLTASEDQVHGTGSLATGCSQPSTASTSSSSRPSKVNRSQATSSLVQRLARGFEQGIPGAVVEGVVLQHRPHQAPGKDHNCPEKSGMHVQKCQDITPGAATKDVQQNDTAKKSSLDTIDGRREPRNPHEQMRDKLAERARLHELKIRSEKIAREANPLQGDPQPRVFNMDCEPMASTTPSTQPNTPPNAPVVYSLSRSPSRSSSVTESSFAGSPRVDLSASTVATPSSSDQVAMSNDLCSAGTEQKRRSRHPFLPNLQLPERVPAAQNQHQLIGLMGEAVLHSEMQG